MSLFKAKEWWSSGSVLLEDSSDLLNGSLKIVQLGPEGSGDVIIYGTPEGLIQIYKPQGSYQPTDTLLEYTTGAPILQVDSGKLMPGSNAEHIAVLHPQSVSVYMFSHKEGHTDCGDQNVLLKQYQHILPRAAYCFIVGQFGGVKNRDFICVQSLDGMLMFYEQDIATFKCLLPNILLPGPLSYSHCADAFITCSSNWIIEAYSYYNLSHISEYVNEKGNSGKKLLPIWSFNVGENINSIQSIQISNNTCSLIMLGEKCMYCLHDNGIMKFMKKFDFVPVCLYAYLIGWYYENNARLMIMVVSETSTLLIYENVSLLWSCQLTFTPIYVSRAFFPNLSGALVMLSESGEVKCCYLGTEPELFTAPPLPNTEVNFDQAQEELENLQAIIESHHDISEHNLINKAAERELTFHVHINALELNDEVPQGLVNSEESIQYFKCKVEVKLKPSDSKNIEFLQVTFDVQDPLICSKSNQIIMDITDKMSVETWVYMYNDLCVSNLSLSIVVLFMDCNGNMRILKKEEQLPFKLVCFPVSPIKESIYKVTINVAKPTVDLIDLFNDFNADALKELGSSNTVVAFSSYFSIDSPITIISAKSTQRYRLQSNNLFMLNMGVSQFINRVKLLFNKKPHSQHESEENVFNLNSGDLSNDIFKGILQIIENHALSRQELINTEVVRCMLFLHRVSMHSIHNESLDVLSNQFILIQKKLMIKYRERAPKSCDGIILLLYDTHSKIVNTASKIQQLKQSILRCSSEVASAMELLITLLSIQKDQIEIDNIKSAICYKNILQEDYMWEENVVHNIIYLMKTIYAKSDKDRDKLIPFDQSQLINKYDVKRLLKYFHIFFNSLFNKQDKLTDDKLIELTSGERLEIASSMKLLDDGFEDGVKDESVFKIPEGSLFGYKKPLLTVRMEKQEITE